MLNEDFVLVNEVFDSEANEYVMSFECSQETYEDLVKHYGTIDFEDQLSKDFHDYVMTFKEDSDEQLMG